MKLNRREKRPFICWVIGSNYGCGDSRAARHKENLI